ncbi:uncharacterized protein LOC128743760 [Sabethes cyaneus]|uniref:uncharacterized protein LOC128743760 n=1 Tax=Sabethes cyaneus TaxID=53552 RepID=UPI00237E848C|nr:uncharacterized protein LOC128743760 [Sabethes cyaneus]
MVVITENQLFSIVNQEHVELDVEILEEVAKQINEMTEDPNEAAMFIAHMLYWSPGFRIMKDYKQGAGQPCGEKYYSRGYLSLMWDYNYRAASQALFNDNRLFENPDLATESPEMCMRVSVWIWTAQVRPQAAPFDNFYATTKAINGDEETSSSHPEAKQRYFKYERAARYLGVTPVPEG